MARKSRKPTAQPENPKRQEHACRAALYARLSSEDLHGKTNRSIENQIALLERFIQEQQDISVYGVYTDRGESGTNFERQGFQGMMEDVRNGAVNCIVVKDLSRFGRNYIETGDYIENILPFMGVRFIAVNDGYDSARGGESLTVPLKNVINDLYARDVSRKVSSSFAVKQRRGEFLGTFAPYGYLKAQGDPKHLIPDPVTAPVVARIFQWREQGFSLRAIAGRLDGEGICPPAQYRCDMGLIKEKHRDSPCGWHKSAVARILANPVYLGHMAQAKQKTSVFQGHGRINIPQSGWVIVENTHEPIIDAVLFQAAQTGVEGE